jgi:hypothetical protein
MVVVITAAIPVEIQFTIATTNKNRYQLRIGGNDAQQILLLTAMIRDLISPSF